MLNETSWLNYLRFRLKFNNCDKMQTPVRIKRTKHAIFVTVSVRPSFKTKFGLLVKRVLVLFYFLPGEFVKFRINVHNFVFRFDLNPFLEFVVNRLPPHQDTTEFFCSCHNVIAREKGWKNVLFERIWCEFKRCCLLYGFASTDGGFGRSAPAVWTRQSVRRTRQAPPYHNQAAGDRRIDMRRDYVPRTVQSY